MTESTWDDREAFARSRPPMISLEVSGHSDLDGVYWPGELEDGESYIRADLAMLSARSAAACWKALVTERERHAAEVSVVAAGSEALMDALKALVAATEELLIDGAAVVDTTLPPEAVEVRSEKRRRAALTALHGARSAVEAVVWTR